MIAIQADLLEVSGQKIINFTKILDIYEEEAEDDETNIVNEANWSSSASWILQTANELLSILNSNGALLKLNFTQSYISLVNDKGKSYCFYRRSDPKSYLGFKEKNDEKVESIKNLLDLSAIQFTYNKSQEFLIVVDKDFIKKHKDVFININKIRVNNIKELSEE